MTRFTKSSFAAAIALLTAPAIHANPGGGTVVAGDVTIGQGSQMVITQNSSSAIVNWNSFSVAAGESVRFDQPTASAAILNRVTGNSASQILGSISANGRVFLVNPRGIVFGSSAQIDVGSLIASTLAISDSDFSVGAYRFTQGTEAAASVVNQGSLTAENGNVVLLGDSVNNRGTIKASLGHIDLLSGSALTLSFDNAGLVSYQFASNGTTSSATAAVNNSGVLDGASVYMSAALARSVISAAVNNTGTIKAARMESGADGLIVLAAVGGDVVVGGSISGDDVIVASSNDISKAAGTSLDLQAGALNMTANGSIQLTSDNTALNNSTVHVGSGQAADIDTALISALQQKQPDLVPLSLYANASFNAGGTVALGNTQIDGGYLAIRSNNVSAQAIATAGTLFYNFRPADNSDGTTVTQNTSLPILASAVTFVFGGGNYSGDIDVVGSAQSSDTANYAFLTTGNVANANTLRTSGAVALLGGTPIGAGSTGDGDGGSTGGGSSSGSGGDGGQPQEPVTPEQVAAITSVTSDIGSSVDNGQQKKDGSNSALTPDNPGEQASTPIEQQPAEVPCQ